MATVAVIGSRSFADRTLLHSVLDTVEVGRIVSGGAVGADTLGAAYAREKGIHLIN